MLDGGDVGDRGDEGVQRRRRCHHGGTNSNEKGKIVPYTQPMDVGRLK